MRAAPSGRPVQLGRSVPELQGRALPSKEAVQVAAADDPLLVEQRDGDDPFAGCSRPEAKENEMNDHQQGGQDDARPPSWLTPEEEAVWRLEGFDQLPTTVTVPFAARFIGLSRSSAYNCVRNGEIRAVRFGRRLVVPRSELFKALFKFRPPRPEAA
jgi:excisionase family DNA binding protein